MRQTKASLLPVLVPEESVRDSAASTPTGATLPESHGLAGWCSLHGLFTAQRGSHELVPTSRAAVAADTHTGNLHHFHVGTAGFEAIVLAGTHAATKPCMMLYSIDCKEVCTAAGASTPSGRQKLERRHSHADPGILRRSISVATGQSDTVSKQEQRWEPIRGCCTAEGASYAIARCYAAFHFCTSGSKYEGACGLVVILLDLDPGWHSCSPYHFADLRTAMYLSIP